MSSLWYELSLILLVNTRKHSQCDNVVYNGVGIKVHQSISMVSKNKLEAQQEVLKGNETVEYALSAPQLMQGKVEEVSRGVFCQDVRVPLGVCVSLVPFNFPGKLFDIENLFSSRTRSESSSINSRS